MPPLSLRPLTRPRTLNDLLRQLAHHNYCTRTASSSSSAAATRPLTLDNQRSHAYTRRAFATESKPTITRTPTTPTPATKPQSQSQSRPQPQSRSGFRAPATHDRGPASTEDTQTDFSSLDVLGSTPAPSTSIDACLWDGFHLNNGVQVTGGAGVILVAGEVFEWRPWEEKKNLVNAKGQWEVRDSAWGVFGVVWPKPDLLIIGLGKDMRPLAPETRKYINSLGIRIDIQDTRNAAAQFNLLATERGVGNVAAAMIPIGWREGIGIKSMDDNAAGVDKFDVRTVY